MSLAQDRAKIVVIIEWVSLAFPEIMRLLLALAVVAVTTRRRLGNFIYGGM